MKPTIGCDQFWPGCGEIRLAEGPERWAFIGCRDGEKFLFTVPWDRTDGGRSNSRRPRQSNDCTVRALATAASVEYDTAYDELMSAGRKAGRGFHFRKWASASTFNGYRFDWIGFPAVKGMWRVNPVLFAMKFRQGRFILKTAKHVLACVDGRVSDEGRNAEGACVYGAWQLIEENGK